MEEKKVQKSIKEAAKRGDMGACKVRMRHFLSARNVLQLAATAAAAPQAGPRQMPRVTHHAHMCVSTDARFAVTHPHEGAPLGHHAVWPFRFLPTHADSSPSQRCRVHVLPPVL